MKTKIKEQPFSFSLSLSTLISSPARKTEKLQRDGDGGKAGASGFHWLFGSDSEPYFLLAFSRWRILRGGKRGRGKGGGGGGERESGDVQVA